MAQPEQSSAARELDAAIGDVDEIDFASDPIAAESKNRADRYAWALRYRLNEIDELRAVVEARKAEMDTWLEIQLGRRNPSIEWLTKSLELYGRAENERNDKTKTIELPGGITIKISKPREVVDVRDPDGFIAWAKAEHKATVEFIETLDDEELRAKFTAKAELLAVLVNEPPTPAPTPFKPAIAKLNKQETSVPFGDFLETSFILDGEVIPGVASMRLSKNEVTVKATPGDAQ